MPVVAPCGFERPGAGAAMCNSLQTNRTLSPANSPHSRQGKLEIDEEIWPSEWGEQPRQSRAPAKHFLKNANTRENEEESFSIASTYEGIISTNSTILIFRKFRMDPNKSSIVVFGFYPGLVQEPRKIHAMLVNRKLHRIIRRLHSNILLLQKNLGVRSEASVHSGETKY